MTDKTLTNVWKDLSSEDTHKDYSSMWSVTRSAPFSPGTLWLRRHLESSFREDFCAEVKTRAELSQQIHSGTNATRFLCKGSLCSDFKINPEVVHFPTEPSVSYATENVVRCPNVPNPAFSGTVSKEERQEEQTARRPMRKPVITSNAGTKRFDPASSLFRDHIESRRQNRANDGMDDDDDYDGFQQDNSSKNTSAKNDFMSARTKLVCCF